MQNVGRGISERLGTVNLLQGKQLVPVTELHAGDLGVVAKLKESPLYETVTDPTKGYVRASENDADWAFDFAIPLVLKTPPSTLAARSAKP